MHPANTIGRLETAPAARALSASTLASRLLYVAFAISALYQLFRSTQMELPAYDSFDLTAAIYYGLCFGIATTLATGRAWAKWLNLAAAIGWNLVGIFFYYPTMTAGRTFGLLGWAEATLYLGLIFAAGVLIACDLAGITLTSARD